MELRYGGVERIGALAQELVNLQPDIIVTCVARSRATSRCSSGEIRDGREPQDRLGAHPDGAAIDSAESGRGDRMKGTSKSWSDQPGTPVFPVYALTG
jgi:hypothetical protein